MRFANILICAECCYNGVTMKHPESIALHHGYEAEETTRAAAVPIYQTTSYTFKDTQHGADLFDLKVEGNIYTRIMNPTTAVLEARIAQMEGAVGALGMASGMSAITCAIQTIAGAGDNIVSTSQLYGGTYNLFQYNMPHLGIDVRFASFDDYDKMEQLIDERTKLLFCESIGNPAGNVVDLERLADIAHRNGIPLVVDGTVTTPILCKHADFGADIIIHSLTKYIGGHGIAIGGIVVDTGKFDWTSQPKKFAILNEPDPSYHGVVYTEALGEAAFIGRCRVGHLRNTGAALSPHNAFHILQGLETLALRMGRHCDNALAVAKYLQSHKQVEWVNYAGLPDSKYHEVCKKMTGGRASGILSFGIRGGREAGTKFIDALQMILRLVNIGDAKSLACHPATTTHRQLGPAELADAGVSEELVRISVGIEHPEDIIADIEQALKAAA